MSSEEGPTVVFEPWSRKASIAGSSYIVQIGKVEGYWSIAIYRGKDIIAVKKVGTLDPNVLTSVISSSISLPLYSPYAIVRSLGNIISEAKVRKYPITYTPTPEEEPQKPTPPPTPAAPTPAPPPAPAPAPTSAPAPEPASAPSPAPEESVSDFESLGFKRVSAPSQPYEKAVEGVSEAAPGGGEEPEEELGGIDTSEEMLGEFAAGPSMAFRSMFEAEEAPSAPSAHESAAPLMEIPDLQPLEKWQKGVAGLTFFLDIAISYVKKKHGKELDKLWQYYRDAEISNWKAAKGKSFAEIVKILVNIMRAMGSEVEVRGFTESSFKARVTKCLGKSYKKRYKAALPLPDEFPCILCKTRGEAISRNLGYSFSLDETPDGCQLVMSSSSRGEKLVI
ncbi:MAG: hypothetical protein ACTSUQ_11720 [Candidatus Freyarchaeota archaeon]